MLNSLINNIIDEVKYSGLTRKQKTITKLFPQFPGRVKAIAGMGGLRLSKVEPDLWHFKVHSGTKDDVWYDDYVKFKNIDEILRKHIKNKKLWNKSGTRILLPRLAKEVLFDTDMQLSCSCPAQSFYGGDYILSLNKYDAKYGEPETRPPKIKNPRQYGAYCKHLQNVVNVLPWYESTMAKYLKQFFMDDIHKYEQEVLKVEKPKQKPIAPATAKKKTVKKSEILRKLKKRKITKPKESKVNEDKPFRDLFQPISKEEFEKRRKERLARELPGILREGKCTLNPDGTYSCEGSVSFYDLNLTKLPVKFKEVKGDFNCYYNNLISLEGAPKRVGRMFNCSHNKLTSLKGGPERVGGDFNCAYNDLRTLEGGPKEVGEDFYCNYNQLTSLEGGPREVGEGFNCSYNNLTSLEGSPEKVKGNFYCSFNKLTSLEGGPERVGGAFNCSYNDLRTLEGGPKEVGEDFYCNYNQLTSLEGAPKEVGRSFGCSHNKLTSLEGGPKEVGRYVYFGDTPIASKLGISTIKGSELHKYI